MSASERETTRRTIMYLITLRDGTVIATSTRAMADYLWGEYETQRACLTFCENLDAAIEQANYVIE
jgi:hypothetical protein